MEALQSYIFENSNDFPEIHYINLMKLALEVYNNLQEPKRFFNTQEYRENYDRKIIESVRNQMGIFRNVTITEEYWNDHFKSIIEESPDREIRQEQFIAKLKLLNDQPTQFVFHHFVPRILRHKIHEMNHHNMFTTKTTNRTWNEHTHEYSVILNIFVK